jgi:Trk-type K+ transport system membrane component
LIIRNGKRQKLESDVLQLTKATSMNHTDDILTNKPAKRRIRKQSHKFSFTFYQAFFGPIVLIKAIYRQISLLSIMFISGAAIFSHYDHLPVINALLASVSTITTIGLFVPNGGNFFTINQTESVLLIILIIISVGAGASILQSSVSTIVNGNIAKD